MIFKLLTTNKVIISHRFKSFSMFYDTLTIVDCNDRIYHYDYDDILMFTVSDGKEIFVFPD